MSTSQTQVEAAFARYLEAFRSGADRDVDAEAFVDGVEPGLRRELARLIADYHELRRQMGDASMLLEGGRVLGDYRLVREVGRGGMAVVWEAEDLNLGRRVALKLLAPHHSLSTKALQRFAREARAGGRLAHRGIVPTFGAGEACGVHYIVQELVPGGYTLADELRAQRDQPPPGAAHYRRAALLIAKIADALHHAHEAGVVHRDVKPGNVLLTEEDEPRLTDFGLARIQDEVGLSRTGSIEGTPFYMSPEQAEARRDAIDRRTDVFSLGATLYELLTHRRAFDGDTSTQVFHRIRHVDPPEPRTLRTQVPAELGVIALKALQKEPARRYPTAAAMADDLRRFLAHEPILARPPGALAKGVKWTRRHPVLTATTGCLLAATGVILVLLIDARRERAHALFSAAEARQAERRAEQQRELADEARRAVLAATEEIAWQSYVANVTLAGLHASEKRFGEARARLAQAPPVHRDWEWEHLAATLEPCTLRITPAAGEGYTGVALAPGGGDAGAAWVATAARVDGLALHALDNLPHGAPTLAWRVPPDAEPAAWPIDVAYLPPADLVSRWSDDTLRLHALTDVPGKHGEPGGRERARFESLDPRGRRHAIGEPLVLSFAGADPDASAGSAVRIAYVASSAPGLFRGANARIEVLDPRSGAIVPSPTFSERPRAPLVCAFDGRVWAVFAQRLLVFDPAHPDDIEEIPGDFGLVPPDEFAADAAGRIAFAGGQRIDLATGALEQIDGIFHSLDARLLPDGERLLRQYDGELQVFDLASGSLLTRRPGHGHPLAAHAASLDGRRLATVDAGAVDGSLRLWDTAGEGPSVKWPVATGVSWAQESANGELLALTRSRGFATVVLELLDGRTGAIQAEHSADWIPRHAPGETGERLALDASGVRLFVRHHDRIDVRDALTGALVATPPELVGRVRDMTLASDGRHLGVLVDDELRVWHTEDGLAARAGLAARLEAAGVQRIALSHDARYAALAAADGVRVAALDSEPGPETLRPIAPLPDPAGDATRWGLALDPSGARLVVCNPQRASLFDVASGARIATLHDREPTTHHTATHAAFSPDGARLATTCGDGTLRLWDSHSGAPLATLDGARSWPRFSSAGARLVCVDVFALRIRGRDLAAVRNLWPAAHERQRALAGRGALANAALLADPAAGWRERAALRELALDALGRAAGEGSGDSDSDER